MGLHRRPAYDFQHSSLTGIRKGRKLYRIAIAECAKDERVGGGRIALKECLPRGKHSTVMGEIRPGILSKSVQADMISRVLCSETHQTGAIGIDSPQSILAGINGSILVALILYQEEERFAGVANDAQSNDSLCGIAIDGS